MEIDRELLRILRADINAALVEVGKRHEVLLEAANASFTPEQATFKLLVVPASGKRGETAKYATAEADWNRLYSRYGFNKGWLGKTFTYAGEHWKILGLRPSRPKYPVLAEKLNGRGTVKVLTVETLMAAKAMGALK